MISQRNCGQFIRSPQIVSKIDRKITLVFHYFACIEKYASQLFCTGDIENINQAIAIYEKYEKKLLLIFYVYRIFSRKNYSRLGKLLKENIKKELQFLLGSKNLGKKFFRIKAKNNFFLLIKIFFF